MFDMGQAVREATDEWLVTHEHEMLLRQAIHKVEASGVLSDVELSVIKSECGV